MRLIHYYNPPAFVFFVLIASAAFFLMCRKRHFEKRTNHLLSSVNGGSASLSPKLYLTGIILFTLLGFFLRFYKLGLYPYGLQQDEASIGYDAFCLANYGIDRNGYPNPIYPITWGSGGGSPMLIWMNTLTTRLFGVHPFSIRIIPAVFGALTLCLFIFYLSRLCGIRAAFSVQWFSPQRRGISFSPAGVWTAISCHSGKYSS